MSLVLRNGNIHCNENPIYVFLFLELCSLSPISTSCVCKQFIYSQDRTSYFPAAEQVDQSWEYINRSQTHEYGNWDCGRAIPFLEIFVSNVRYCFLAVYTVREYSEKGWDDSCRWVRVVGKWFEGEGTWWGYGWKWLAYHMMGSERAGGGESTGRYFSERESSKHTFLKLLILVINFFHYGLQYSLSLCMKNVVLLFPL